MSIIAYAAHESICVAFVNLFFRKRKKIAIAAIKNVFATADEQNH
jgi:hypothetical protein